MGWCHLIRGDMGYLPSETRFKAIHGALGRRHPCRLTVSEGRYPISPLSVWACRSGVSPRLFWSCARFENRGETPLLQESTKLSGNVVGVHPPCHHGSNGTYFKESRHAFKHTRDTLCTSGRRRQPVTALPCVVITNPESFCTAAGFPGLRLSAVR